MERTSSISASLKNIYTMLQDEESRGIYLNMVNYFFSGDIQHILNRDHFYNKDSESRAYSISSFIMDYKKYEQTEKQEIILYGADAFNLEAANHLEQLGIKVNYFCDFMQEKQNKRKGGLLVLPPEEVVKHHKDCILLFTNHSPYVSKIIKLGLTHGMNRNQFKIPHPFGKIYFGIEDIVPYENEVFIDCGSFTGNTIANFLTWCKGTYKKIYAIEPDPESFQLLQQSMEAKHVKNIHLINNGVWSCTAALPFYKDGELSSFCQDAYFLSPHPAKVYVNTIDNIAHDDAVTFIKMDIQGGELEALKGAADTIVKRKPRLAISVYHKPKDIIEIPLFIHNLIPDYKFYLRQHTFLTDDTVLYAV